MSEQIINILADQFKLTADQKRVMALRTRKMNRADRKLLFGSLVPERKQYLQFLRDAINQEASKEAEWLEATVQSILAFGGEPDFADKLIVSLLGRITVYQEVNRQAQETGQSIKALQSNGGCTVFLMTITVVGALIALLVLSFFK